MGSPWRADWVELPLRNQHECSQGKVRFANALGELPKISASFEKGELSYSKVRAMTRVATPENEDFLLNIAHHGTAYHMEKLVSSYRRARRLHERKVANEQYLDRSLKYSYDEDGSLIIKSRFPAEQGALIVKALERAMVDDESAVNAGHANSSDDISAETRGIADTAETPGANVSAEAREPWSARRADALMGMAESYLAKGPGHSSSADCYQVMLHVSAETLKDDVPETKAGHVSAETSEARSNLDMLERVSAKISDTGTTKSHLDRVSAEISDTGVTNSSLDRVSTETSNPEPKKQTAACDTAENSTPLDEDISHIDDGPHVSAETSRRICCDAGISPILTNSNGEPLNIGRKTRAVPPPMRRALRTRDKGCRFPGCTYQHFIDGHHIKHWADGGETRLDNLVLLCRHHHRLVHEGGFGCERSDSGQLVFKNEHGEVIGISGSVPAMKPNPTVQRRIQNCLEELYIDALTCVTRWDGTAMDCGYVTELLWCRDFPDDDER